MGTGRAGNLPVELTTFVGRRSELVLAKKLLTSARLLTVTGIGGVGKTRFARKLASEVQRNFRDGAHLIYLADLRHEGLVAQTVSAGLGIVDQSSEPVGTLADYLRDRRLLLVLDNCEQVAAPCAALIDRLLREAPDLRVVATSRHVLGVEGEQVFSLPPLASGQVDQETNEALELFEHRASAADPTFRVTDENLDDVVAICRQTDGLPLAVELAAAHVRTFSPMEIRQHLTSLENAKGAGQVRPERQLTIDATMAWSHGLCTPSEQRGWEELSVFLGEFTAESAAAVYSRDAGAESISDVLRGLVDKSIITRVASLPTGEARYRMLEPVRQYGSEKLESSPRAREVRRRHYDHFLRVARKSYTDACSERDIEWYAATAAEQANLRAALEFSLSEADDQTLALELANPLRYFWQQSGQILEGYRWLRRALECNPGATPSRAQGLVAASVLGFLLEEADAARTLLDEHLDLVAEHGFTEFTSLALFASVLEALTGGDVAEAFERAEHGLDTESPTDDPTTTAATMALAAFCAFIADHDRSEEAAERFLNYTRRHGAHLLQANALYALGVVRWRKGDVTAATSFMREAIRIFSLFEHPAFIAICVEGLAWSAAEEGRPERAITLLGAAESLWRYGQVRLAESAVRQIASSVQAKLKRLVGEQNFEAALRTGRKLSLDEAVALALETSPRPPSLTRTAVEGSGGLTAREREIADLVAEGLTNKEIAARLVIAQRTAESHVQNILVKLGFRSRSQIARWVVLNDER